MKQFNSKDLAKAISSFTKNNVTHNEIKRAYNKIENNIVWNRRIIKCALRVVDGGENYYYDMSDSLVVMILMYLNISIHDIDKIFGWHDDIVQNQLTDENL